MGSEERFCYQWTKYRELNPHYESQFKQWLGPISPEFIQNKRIMDAGCGMGRNSYWCLKWGAQKVLAFDNDEKTVNVAQDVLSQYSNVVVTKESIYDIRYESEFDFVFSIGVIQFLENPEEAIARLIRSLKPAGTLLLSVYSHEGNEILIKILSPIRKYLTSKIPPPLLDALTTLVSVPLFLLLRICPFRGSYFQQLKNFKWRHIQLILFDQLHPRITRFYTEREARHLLEGLDNINCTHVNQKTWTVAGTKPAN